MIFVILVDVEEMEDSALTGVKFVRSLMKWNKKQGIQVNIKFDMTREELIQSPEYWETLYENECWRLHIKPCMNFIKSITEEELDKLANDHIKELENLGVSFTDQEKIIIKDTYKAGYNKANGL